MARRATVSQGRGTQPRKSTRQRESERVAKARASRQRRQKIFRVGGFALASVLAVGLAGYSLWGWQSGLVEEFGERMQLGAVRLSARAGFVVHDIYLEGRETVSLETIRRAARLERGDPLFAASPEEIRQRLETIPAIKVAQIERVMPGALHIHITERKPVALWQNENQLHLIDDNGVVMTGGDAGSGKQGGKYANLLLVVGPDAPKHSMELLKVLAAEPELFTQIKAAMRVGGRRWNIRFHNGVEVKLPETNLDAAWHRLAEMQAAQQVLERDIVAIDLRLSDRVYFKLPASAPAAVGAAKKAASET